MKKQKLYRRKREITQQKREREKKVVMKNCRKLFVDLVAKSLIKNGICMANGMR